MRTGELLAVGKNEERPNGAARQRWQTIDYVRGVRNSREQHLCRRARRSRKGTRRRRDWRSARRARRVSGGRRVRRNEGAETVRRSTRAIANSTTRERQSKVKGARSRAMLCRGMARETNSPTTQYRCCGTVIRPRQAWGSRDARERGPVVGNVLEDVEGAGDVEGRRGRRSSASKVSACGARTRAYARPASPNRIRRSIGGYARLTAYSTKPVPQPASMKPRGRKKSPERGDQAGARLEPEVPRFSAGRSGWSGPNGCPSPAPWPSRPRERSRLRSMLAHTIGRATVPPFHRLDTALRGDGRRVLRRHRRGRRCRRATTRSFVNDGTPDRSLDAAFTNRSARPRRRSRAASATTGDDDRARAAPARSCSHRLHSRKRPSCSSRSTRACANQAPTSCAAQTARKAAGSNSRRAPLLPPVQPARRIAAGDVLTVRL